MIRALYCKENGTHCFKYDNYKEDYRFDKGDFD